MKAVAAHSETPETPVHVAIIMDGNGRWAHGRGLPRSAGHKRGAQAVKTVIQSALDAGVAYLTLFGFSSENWKRPEPEVKDLMGLLRYYLRSEIASLHEKGICLKVIGERERLSSDIVKMIHEAEKLTASNTRLTLSIALSYGGRAEIARAARRLAEEVEAGTLRTGDIDERALSGKLFTSGIPDPDILIRTSGEQRVSNFLLWQLAYAELIFVDTLWPDFSKEDFDGAIREFLSRERRYGATGG